MDILGKKPREVVKVGIDLSMPHVRKYQPGFNACASCQRGNHSYCRPRLDGTLCSCSCETADNNRFTHEIHCDAAKQKGHKKPSVSESLDPQYPKIRKQIKDNEEIS